MSNITYTFERNRIFTDPSITTHENVISKVDWLIHFTDGVSTSTAAGTTYIDTSNLENFIPIENITDENLFEMVLDKMGGENFINQLLQYHSDNVSNLTREKNFVIYYNKSGNYMNTGNVGNNATNIGIFEAPIL